jgi:pyruvate kinase
MTLPLHRTKIVATIGPASSSGDVGERLVMMRDEFEEGGSKQSGEGVCAALEHFLEYKPSYCNQGVAA